MLCVWYDCLDAHATFVTVSNKCLVGGHGIAAAAPGSATSRMLIQLAKECVAKAVTQTHVIPLCCCAACTLHVLACTLHVLACTLHVPHTFHVPNTGTGTRVKMQTLQQVPMVGMVHQGRRMQMCSSHPAATWHLGRHMTAGHSHWISLLRCTRRSWAASGCGDRIH